MHHAVTVERVIALHRRVNGVLGIAQVNAVEVGRQIADDLEVVGLPFRRLRPPGTRAVRVVVGGGKGRQHASEHLDVHATQPDPGRRRCPVMTPGATSAPVAIRQREKVPEDPKDRDTHQE